MFMPLRRKPTAVFKAKAFSALSALSASAWTCPMKRPSQHARIQDRLETDPIQCVIFGSFVLVKQLLLLVLFIQQRRQLGVCQYRQKTCEHMYAEGLSCWRRTFLRGDRLELLDLVFQTVRAKERHLCYEAPHSLARCYRPVTFCLRGRRDWILRLAS